MNTHRHHNDPCADSDQQSQQVYQLVADFVDKLGGNESNPNNDCPLDAVHPIGQFITHPTSGFVYMGLKKA